MQFKYPELLWALFLLLIPILVHLFQLRRFKKTPFTNVRLLQKVVAESRKSRSLKKWLLLAARLLILTFLIFAFAQPFFAGKTALKPKETIFYLDNSFSLQAKKDNTTLLRGAVQQLIGQLPKNRPFSLFTNDGIYRNVLLQDIQDQLLDLSFTPVQLQLNDIYLKAGSLFGNDPESLQRLVLISDFQQRIFSQELDSSTNFQKHLIRLEPDNLDNVSIDSVYVANGSGETLDLVSLLSTNSDLRDIPVSLYNNDLLIAKASASFDENGSAKISFTVPKGEPLLGKLEIEDTGLTYDNVLYLNLARKEKIKVLAVGNGDMEFLRRIYTEDGFALSLVPPEDLEHSVLDSQNFLVLHELDNIPTSLQNAVRNFRNNGGSVLIIPSTNIDFVSYGPLLSGLSNTTLLQKVEREGVVASINFSHPLFKGVFKERITNFQYPQVTSYYSIRTTLPKLLSYGEGTPFLVGEDGFYFFTASLSTANTNFKNAPLIVPTLYNMGIQSLRMEPLYGIIGNNMVLDIPVDLGEDIILKVYGPGMEFIPPQTSNSNKTTINFGEMPQKEGWFSIKKEGEVIKDISFNYPREESVLVYPNSADLPAASHNTGLESSWEVIEKGNGITPLWKWFIILALLFVMVEVLIQKIFK